MERTLQLTKSSISFQVSAGTDFKPLGWAEAGSRVADGLNHTSRSFSGPTHVLAMARVQSTLHVRTFECIGRVEVNGSLAIDRQVGGSVVGRRRGGIVLGDFGDHLRIVVD